MYWYIHYISLSIYIPLIFIVKSYDFPMAHLPFSPHAEFGEELSLLLAERAAALTMTFAA